MGVGADPERTPVSSGSCHPTNNYPLLTGSLQTPHPGVCWWPTRALRRSSSGRSDQGRVGRVPIRDFELGPGAALGVVSCVGSPVSLNVLAATSNLIMSLGASLSERTEQLTFTPPMSLGFTFVADAQRLKALAPWHSG